MKQYLSKMSLMILALVIFTALTALAHTRPFHLVEHGTLTPVANQPGHFTAEGTGTATHLGTILVHRTLSLSPSTDGSGLLDVEGEATLVAADGAELRSGLEGTLEDGLDLERNLFASLFDTEDVREGTAAFLQKRTPVFKGK